MYRKRAVQDPVGFAVALCAVALASPAKAEEDGVVTSPPENAEAVMAYWTAERMAAAQPMPLPARAWDAERSASAFSPQPPLGNPGFAPGWDPRSGLEAPDPLTRYEITAGDPASGW